MSMTSLMVLSTLLRRQKLNTLYKQCQYLHLCLVIDKDAVKATASIVTIETNAEEAPINKVAENVAD